MCTVERPARTRLFEAMLAELVEKGYPAVEVGTAAQRARLVSEEWSARFPDKDACLGEAFEELCRQLLERIQEGCLSAGEAWPERVAGGLRALLGQLSERAEMAEALVRDFPAVGPAGQRRYQAFLERLALRLREGRELTGAGVELPAEVEMLAVGAGEAIVFEEIHAGRAAQLARLAPEILFSVLVPFVGPEEASIALEGERARGLELA